jgi:hypothetical protein
MVVEEEKSPELQNIVSFLPYQEERSHSHRLEVIEQETPPETSENENE